MQQSGTVGVRLLRRLRYRVVSRSSRSQVHFFSQVFEDRLIDGVLGLVGYLFWVQRGMVCHQFQRIIVNLIDLYVHV